MHVNSVDATNLMRRRKPTISKETKMIPLENFQTTAMQPLNEQEMTQ